MLNAYTPKTFRGEHKLYEYEDQFVKHLGGAVLYDSDEDLDKQVVSEDEGEESESGGDAEWCKAEEFRDAIEKVRLKEERKACIAKAKEYLGRGGDMDDDVAMDESEDEGEEEEEEEEEVDDGITKDMGVEDEVVSGISKNLGDIFVFKKW